VGAFSWRGRCLTPGTRPGQPAPRAPHRPLRSARSRPRPGPGRRRCRGNRSDV